MPPIRQPETPSERVDERDTMFARMARSPGTAAYEDYYGGTGNGRQKTDDRIRNMTPLMKPGGRCYHPEFSGAAERYFKSIDAITIDDSLVAKWRAKLEAAPDKTAAVKAMLLAVGAVAVGCTELDKAFIYTHKGRLDKNYGEPIDLDHRSAIIFLVEMDFDAMQHAPEAETIHESARQYYRAAEISKVLEAVIAALGHRVKAHYDANYDLILPPLAVKAGLGEVGRNNILVSKHYGSRVRIGAVTTDLEVKYDSPIDLGVEHFCRLCKKCADNCPSRALSTGDMVEVRGVKKWPTHAERCHAYWRALGTDCGICMAACPYSHRNNWFHNLVRLAIRTSRWTHRIALFFENFIYSRKWKPRIRAENPEISAKPAPRDL